MKAVHSIEGYIKEDGHGVKLNLVCSDPSSCSDVGLGCKYDDMELQDMLRTKNKDQEVALFRLPVVIEYDGFGEDAELWATVDGLPRSAL